MTFAPTGARKKDSCPQKRQGVNFCPDCTGFAGRLYRRSGKRFALFFGAMGANEKNLKVRIAVAIATEIVPDHDDATGVLRAGRERRMREFLARLTTMVASGKDNSER